MPKLRETLLQVKERETRQLRLRTEARCAQLLQQYPVAPRTEARCAQLVPQVPVAPTLVAIQNIEEDSNFKQSREDWTICINVSCFLLLLVVANALILEYIWLKKA